MIELNDLISGTAVNVPPHIQRLFALAQEVLALEFMLESLPEGERFDRIWEKAGRREGRRLDALEAALQAHNDAEVMVCGS